MKNKRTEFRLIKVPRHRMSPLRKEWAQIVKLIVSRLNLMIRMNEKKRMIEIKISKKTKDPQHLNKASEFLKAFMLGFGLKDAVAMLRLNDLYLESFEIGDVKPLKGEHLSRCIGRINGQKGRTKNAVENATKTRIVVAGSKIHILGNFFICYNLGFGILDFIICKIQFSILYSF